jgi:hypothetical protein
MAELLETGWLPSTPVGDTLLRRFVHAEGEVKHLLAGATGGRTERTAAVTMADTGGPVPFFNEAILLRPVLDALDPVLDEVEAFLPVERPSTLLSIWPTPDLTARGWFPVGHPALVARPPGDVPDAGPWAIAPDVVVREVTGAEDVAVAERLMIEGYPLPWAAGAPVGSSIPPGAVAAGLRVRIAEVDGEPVAVGLAHTGHGVVNLCGGAAMPAARRRGAWKALVRARVLDGPELPAVAYTSDFSRPGFEALGFLVLTRCTLWGRGGGWG